ncbi:unnamed protein product [Adineta ricciae]|uniref:Uncharacterized protein n=1 Tax=Adineta ricciae TaxID=249248 RepID=A0A813WF20_ADIRI|nr:unnamed protein product [Adineta ricciae]
MEYDSSVSMLLPDSINLIENDFDTEDIVHEQTKQNEIIELIMAAFEGHEEPTDDDDDDDDDDTSLNTSESSYHSFNEQQVHQQTESHLQKHPREQIVVSTKPSLHPHNFAIDDNDQSHRIESSHDKTSENNSITTSPIQYIPLEEQVQVQYIYHASPSKVWNETENQSNKFRLLCTVKDQKVHQLQILCDEYRKKYEDEARTLKYQLELTQQLRHDCEQLLNKIQQTEINKTQLEQKLSNSESLVETLRRQVNESRHVSSNQESERRLSRLQEEHEKGVLSLNEKLQDIHMNLQEKAVENDELRAQLELSYKTNERTVFEQMETITHLTEQLHDSQRQYTELLTKNSLESFSHTESKRQLTRVTEEKEKLELKCQELQSEIRTLREHFKDTEPTIDDEIFAIRSIPIKNLDTNETSNLLAQTIIQENIHLRERIDEFALNEQQFVALNEELQRKVSQYEEELKHRRSDSESSTSSNETVIRKGGGQTEPPRNLTSQIETLKREYADLEEKYDYEKRELQAMIEQLREDVIELDTTKELYTDVCKEKDALEETLRTQFEFELKSKLDDICQVLNNEYEDKLAAFKADPNNYNRDAQGRLRELMEEIGRMKINHEKQISDLNNELDRLKTYEDASNRLSYTEKEFEQLKQDYYNLNIKQKELLETCTSLENETESQQKLVGQLREENDQLRQTVEQLKQDYHNLNIKQNELSATCSSLENELEGQYKLVVRLREENDQLRRTFDQEKEKIVKEIQQDKSKHVYNEDIKQLLTRMEEYENEITKYEGYRVQVQNNLEKLSQQRDAYKTDLKLTKELLTTKEEEFNHLKAQLDECEKHLHNSQEQIWKDQVPIQDLQAQIKQYPLHKQETNQKRSSIVQGTEHEYRDKLFYLENEKRQLEERLYESNRALDLADSHLQQEIEKIKNSLEEDYNRRYELDQKQHQHELQRLRQEFTSDIDKQRVSTVPVTSTKTTSQDIEEIKRMYRAENERLYRENIELSQHQSKLIETHQKQMQIMKKELDDGYNNVINEFQQEQTRLQTRYDQLKRQLAEAQRTIEQLKSNLSLLKTHRYDSMPKLREQSGLERSNSSLHTRLDNLVKLLEQSNEALNQERTLHTKQEFEYQQTISSLQKKIADMIKQHIESIDEVKRELHQERLKNQGRIIPRPTSVPEFAPMDLPKIERRADHSAPNTERFQGNIPKPKRTLPFIQPRERQDKTIDIYIFEIDRFLSQLAQDCSNSPSSSSPLNSTTLCIQVTPTTKTSSVVHQSLPSKSTSPIRKSIECLYMTPTTNKQPSLATSHGQKLLSNDSRPKSASTILISNNQHSISTTASSPSIHRFQRINYKKFTRRTQSHHDDSNGQIETNSKRGFIKHYEQKTQSLPGYTKMNNGTSSEPFHSFSTVSKDNEEEKYSSSSTSANGIKKFVLNSLRMFMTSSPQSKRIESN